jgi:hypothetical protein
MFFLKNGVFLFKLSIVLVALMFFSLVYKFNQYDLENKKIIAKRISEYNMYLIGSEDGRFVLNSGLEFSPGVLNNSLGLVSIRVCDFFQCFFKNGGYGTGYYLGQQNKSHYIISNDHVLNKENCKDAEIRFIGVSTQATFKCKKVVKLKGLEQIDMSIVEIEGDVLLLSSFKLTSSVDPIGKNQRLYLLTAGASSAESFAKNKMGDDIIYVHDEDCLSLDPEDLVQDIEIIDTANNCSIIKSVKAKSSACDLFKGDSGSPVFNFDTNELIGIHFAGYSYDCGNEYKNTKDPSHLQKLKNNSDYRKKYSNYFVTIEQINYLINKEFDFFNK